MPLLNLLFFLLISLLVNSTLIYAVSLGTFSVESLYQENGLLENLQVILLVVAWVLNWRLGSQQSFYLKKLFIWSISLLCFCFIFREIDFERLGLPYMIVVVTSGFGRNLFYALSWITMLTIFCYQWRFRWAQLKQCLDFNIIFSLTGCLVCLLISDVFDHGWVKIPDYPFYEELAEVNAYLFLVTLFFLSQLTSIRSTNNKN